MKNKFKRTQLLTRYAFFLGAAVLACSAPDSVAAGHGASPNKPNIIFILADDLGCGDLGVMGHPYVQSPNIDRLANEGIRLEQAYAAAAWCSPSRAAFMNGVFPAREFNANKWVLSADRPTLTSMLKKAGYATAHFGKWHMGQSKSAPPPADYGIDENFGTQSTGPVWTDKEMKQKHHRERTAARYVDLSIDFMTRKKDQPFFINLWVHNTHAVLKPTPEQKAVYKDLEVSIDDFEYPLQREFLEFIAKHGNVQNAMRAFCADVTALDKEIGRLLDSLAELGLEENTIVIFTSDNGPAPVLKVGDWDRIIPRFKKDPNLMNSVGSAGPYRDRKFALHDGGIHVPFFIRWPAKINPGIDRDTVFCGVDLMPTLAELVGADAPEEIDGEDLSEAWLGAPQAREKTLLWSDNPRWLALRDRQWKAHLQGDTVRLYSLNEDLSESNDLAGAYPEVAGKYFKTLKQWEISIYPKGASEPKAGGKKKKNLNH
ncbi:sulfatase family protein [Pontiella sulfatireligans]|uniref:Arylsulfatase n=1 Tax=Pontiella sulfatireligans TaxID=2750658 RepID=A0A6C2UJ92_9BACT|nr:sulfatase-like hydrolase/transferase [Pontiella sulfatireligans]SPS74338.1 sulfatase S1_22 [Kiritimatiellales bacterium]VGO19481.1 Arylsulfatase [Pontiella sulfatireligans]